MMPIPIAFELNGRPLELEVTPAERLLDLLRYRLDLTGTKEGCGEGECGSCTVLLDGLPVDSCLVPAYQAHGREIRTVETLARDGLEPFLETGATQCGACTPGVVMTGRWIASHPELLATHTVRELMAGNLCRCTGYDGIVEGVEAAAARPGRAWIDGGPEVAPLPLERATIKGRGRILSPDTLEEALVMLRDCPNLVPVAGATDLLVHWPAGARRHDGSYLDLSRLRDLRELAWGDDALVLGGLTTYWDTIRDRRVRETFPMLVEAARQVGAVQIQARGTWAGNIVNASPAADGVAALMALDATVELTSADGTEEVALSRFYTGYKTMRRRPDQLVTAIRVPARPYAFQSFHKVGSRAAQAITKVGVAIARRDEAGGGESPPGPNGSLWRVAANSVAPAVVRCRAVEALLERGPALRGPEDLRPALEDDVSPIDDIRSTARYRQEVLARLIYFGVRDHATEATP